MEGDCLSSPVYTLASRRSQLISAGATFRSEPEALKIPRVRIRRSIARNHEYVPWKFGCTLFTEIGAFVCETSSRYTEPGGCLSGSVMKLPTRKTFGNQTELRKKGPIRFPILPVVRFTRRQSDSHLCTVKFTVERSLFAVAR